MNIIADNTGKILKNGSKVYLVVENQQTIEVTEKYKIDGENILIIPGTSISDITGAENKSSVFGTGAKIKIEDKEYNLVMLGDVNGDGEVKSKDYMMIKNYIMGTLEMSETEKKAADVNGDGNITPADYVKVKNHIMNVSKISL